MSLLFSLSQYSARVNGTFSFILIAVSNSFSHLSIEVTAAQFIITSGHCFEAIL